MINVHKQCIILINLISEKAKQILTSGNISEQILNNPYNISQNLSNFKEYPQLLLISGTNVNKPIQAKFNKYWLTVITLNNCQQMLAILKNL